VEPQKNSLWGGNGQVAGVGGNLLIHTVSSPSGCFVAVGARQFSCAVSLAVNYSLLAYTRYEGHPVSSYLSRFRLMITTRKDRTNNAELIHLLTG
jgi:hypothetical protein